MESNILGISGKKSGGKTTSVNYIIGRFLRSLEIAQEFKITPEGKLWISDIFGDSEEQGIFDVFAHHMSMRSFCKEHLDEFVKVYSYADLLKNEVCINVLGLSWEQCYGSDEEKNTLTHLKWEDMPGVVTVELQEFCAKDSIEVKGRLGKYHDKLNGVIYHSSGQMTAREVMQFAGTEIFRKMYPNVWVDATIRKIKEDSPLLAIISDCRFVNEIEGVNKSGGKVIRFLRDPNKGKDQHESETALDNYPLENYHAVIDNDNMTIDEQNETVAQILADIGWLPQIAPEELFND